MSNTILEDRTAGRSYALPLLKQSFSGGHSMEETGTFGDWLKAKRDLHRLTQKQLADATDGACTDAYISALEKNKKTKKTGRVIQPDKQIVDALARAMGESIAEAREAAGYLPGQSAEGTVAMTTTLPDDSAQVISIFSRLSEDERARLMNALNALYGAAAPQYPDIGGLPVGNPGNAGEPHVRVLVDPPETAPTTEKIAEPERKRA